VSTVTIHYGNWIMLPERVLKALGLTTGDRLDIELAGG
jgi:antitoxin component of MazEF toxin-antitoxin module